MDQRQFLSSLSAGERAELTQRRNAPGVMRCAVLMVLVSVLALAIEHRVALWPLLCLPLGLLLVFSFTLMHETSHGTVFTSKLANRGVAALCGLILLLPPTWFLHFHLAHHRFTQDPSLDPELASPKPQNLVDYLLHLSGIRIWLSSIKTLYRNASGTHQDAFVPDAAWQSVKHEARIMLLFYALVFTASIANSNSAVLWLWIVPLILGQPFLRVFLLAEHGLCPRSADQNTRNMFVLTRTTLTNRFVRWLSWNMSYHTEHHVYPTVPFHRLPQLHHRLKQYLHNTSGSYLQFHQELLAQNRYATGR